MHDLEKWWSALNPNTISSRAFSHQQIEEEVDVLIEVCHDRLQSETKKLGDDGLEVLEEDAETKANDGAKLGDPAEMRGKNETRTIHDDILEKVKSRVDALSLVRGLYLINSYVNITGTAYLASARPRGTNC